MEFVLIVLPAFIIFAVGYVGQKTIGFDIKSISVMTTYLMYPFLVFRTFYTNKITLDYFYILIFCLLLCFILMVIVKIVSKLKKLPQSIESAMMLSAVFMNSGNYGAPIILFVFGQTAFDYAVIMMVIQSFLMNTIGLYYAAIGSKEDSSIKSALMKIVKMPVLYGSAAGILLQILHVPVPDFIMQPVGLIADATIPTIMVILGMQLANIQLKSVKAGDVASIFIIRMIISPIISIGIILCLPLEDLLAKILIILASMPTAANTTMFAVQFQTEPDLVSFSTLTTTLASIATVPLLLALLS
ncbi:MAG: AEC family transporter [Bacillaceae bacterium]|jgi:predicted permease|uniref:Uncharacterized protein n=2 Tax=Aeribacillus TaxID=1055323 RepID=A0A165XTY3_9BACI|nr:MULTISPECIES: AEC family transporter [Aeribacillus]REJ19072.1 MAG: AEC family transporter [Bacillaceae bacterium]KZN96418.1 hypothetical protein AZI98_08670 [Aeribacillus pallidus]MED0651770.1 AEC family transporter [Aeribacillus composti]MED0702885.1 AEC family transporter [Aeribacillus composti]MED0714974.1 AEC family transporter [Aeribacillus composti]